MIQKIIITFLTATLLLNVSANAQTLKISKSSIVIDENPQASLKAILEPDTKAVKKAYKRWMEDQHDVDVDGIGFLKNKDVLKIKKEAVKKISPKKIDLFARIVEVDGKTEMQVYGNLGYDIPITPIDYPLEYSNMQSVLYGFLNNYLPGYYEELVEDSQDLVDDIKDDRSDAKDELKENRESIEDLIKENKDLAAKIKDYENKLKAAEKTLAQTKDKKAKVMEKANNDK